MAQCENENKIYVTSDGIAMSIVASHLLYCRIENEHSPKTGRFKNVRMKLLVFSYELRAKLETENYKLETFSDM
jgi:hypothetical protein